MGAAGAIFYFGYAPAAYLALLKPQRQAAANLKAHVAPVQRPLRKRLSRTAAPAFLATASPL